MRNVKRGQTAAREDKRVACEEKMNYTPGNWAVQYIGQGLTNVILNGNADDVIAIVDNQRDNHSPNDADMISAAPAMYEALKAIRKVTHEWEGTGKFALLLYELQSLEAAIQKAEGK